MILCKQCGTKNTHDRHLCASCGKKLDPGDPTLLVLDEEPLAAKPKTKVEMEGGGVFSGFFSKFFFFLLFVGVYLMASTGHVPDEPISLSSIQSLDQKLEKSGEHATLSLEAREINVWIERQLLPHRDALKKQFPGFFTFQKAFVQVNPLEFILHFQFHLFQKPILISFSGCPAFQDDTWTFKANRARIGKLRAPLWLLKNLLSKIEREGFQDTLAAFKNPLPLRVSDSRLELFLGQTSEARPEGATAPPQDTQITDDTLLIQAADYFRSQKRYALAVKYYGLVLIKTPGSPLRDHAKKQLHFCQEHL